MKEIKTAFEMVGEFHSKFGHAVETTPQTPDVFDIRLRLNLIAEEFKELIEAVGANYTAPNSALNVAARQMDVVMDLINAANDGEFQPDLVEVADALTDILYVGNGAGHVFGLDLDKAMTEVHRSNMSKLGADGKPIYNEDTGKVLKGPNYSAPNLAAVLSFEG